MELRGVLIHCQDVDVRDRVLFFPVFFVQSPQVRVCGVCGRCVFVATASGRGVLLPVSAQGEGNVEHPPSRE